MTARDVVYGRRGGGWAAKPRTTPAKPVKARKAAEHEPCAACGTAVTIPTPRPDTWRPCCGHLHCRARTTWTHVHWEGRARMADARLAAGVGLTGLDSEALDHRERNPR